MPSYQDKAAWLAQQPEPVREAWIAAQPQNDQATYKVAVQGIQEEDFRNGKQDQGVNALGQGAGMDRDLAAGTLIDQNIKRQQAVLDSVSKNPEDYVASTATEADTGGDYLNQVKSLQLGQTNNVQVDKLGNPINQHRTDTTGVDQQKALLGEYQKLYSQGGLSDQDRARMEQSRLQRGTEARGRNLAIMQDAEEKGRAGGNAQLLSRLQSTQDFTNARTQDDLNTSALGLSRQNELLAGRGTVASSIQAGTDAIDHYNTEGERSRAAANQAATNAGHIRDQADQTSRDIANQADMHAGLDTNVARTQGIADRGATRTDVTSRFNAGPDQGARGQTADLAGATAGVNGATSDGVRLLQDIQDRKNRIKTAKQDRVAGAVTGTANTVLQLGKAVAAPGSTP